MGSAFMEHFGGGFLIEMFLVAVFYGISTCQAYVYWSNFPRDGKLTRAAVVTVWVMETVHTFFCLDKMYTIFVVDFGDIEEVLVPPWSGGATVLGEALIAVTVQSFFIRRIYILSQGSKWIMIPAFLALSRFVFALACAILLWLTPTWTQFAADRTSFVITVVTLALTVAVDFSVMVLMIYHLQHSRTGFDKTDHLVKTLMIYTVNTGALTMLTSIMTVITFILVKDSLVYAGLIEVEGKIYANTFLAVLNARRHINKGNFGLVNLNSVQLADRAERATDHGSASLALQDAAKMEGSGPAAVPCSDTATIALEKALSEPAKLYPLV